MKCDHCGYDAVTFIRYNGAHLCAHHFMKYVEKRVKREIRKQIDLKPGDKIAILLSLPDICLLSMIRAVPRGPKPKIRRRRTEKRRDVP